MTTKIGNQMQTMQELAQHLIEHHGFGPGDYPESDRGLLEETHAEDHERGTALIVDGDGNESERSLDHDHE